MKFIQFKANNDRNMTELNKNKQRRLCKLIIYTKKLPFKEGLHYYRSYVKVVDNKPLHNKLIKEMSEDINKYNSESTDNASVITDNVILDLD